MEMLLILPSGETSILKTKRMRLDLLQKAVEGPIEAVYFQDDPMGFWHVGYFNEEGLLRKMSRNPTAERLFPHYNQPFVGPCVVVEGLNTYWYDAKTNEKVRRATREECLKASAHDKHTLEENGIQMYIEHDDE